MTDNISVDYCEIGDTFVFNGEYPVELRASESVQNCNECFFRFAGCGCTHCTPGSRKDGQFVIYRAVDANLFY